ncbi:Hsp70 family protein [Pseudonocardia hispaniensis]|uniref:Hsp70 family protein n=2 Tax=Pseudonocardia hispaniensis TaxID=904933 RepID=A0ABW1J7Q5_9PSEU
MSYLLGIDLGTTYTAAAVCRSSGHGWVEPEMVSLGDRSIDVPSVLFVAGDGSVVVGEAAERRAVTDPDRVVREFKRRVGDPTPVVVAGRAWAAEELSARLVRWVVDRVAEREGGPAAAIAVAHPAAWGAHKRELLAGALRRVGLVVTFVAEPQAAAVHYAGAERVEAGARIAVYDLGGGTFDAAVVRKGDPGAGGAGFGLLGRPEGIERLGGVDFDQAVFDHVLAGCPEAFEGLDEADPAVLGAVARVRRECTEAKEALSADTEVTVPVVVPGVQASVRLHRSEFEQMIRPRVEETVAALRRAVDSAGLTPEQLTAVLLVGGSSRIPLVAQLVSEQLGRPVAVDADPKNAIAKGAVLTMVPAPADTAEQTKVVASGVPPTPSPDVRPSPLPPPPPPKNSLAAAAGPIAGAGPAFGPDPRTGELPTTAAEPGTGYHPDEPSRGYAGPDHASEPGARRRPVLLVGAGGAVAVLAIVGAVLLWPQGGPTSSATTRIDPGAPTPTLVEEPSTPVRNEPVLEPDPRGVTRAPQTSAPLPPPPVVPPPVTTTPPVVTTTKPPTTPPTTTPPVVTTTKPPTSPPTTAAAS